MTKFKPMLAEGAEIQEIRLPCYVSPKLDGVRAMVINGRMMSRSLKPIPNEAVQAWTAANAEALEGMDGELIYGDPTDPKAFNVTTSMVMSANGPSDITFHVFDLINAPGCPFAMRYDELSTRVATLETGRVRLVPHSRVKTREELAAVEEIAVKAGYEGIMTRAPNGPYKHGRSTLNEQWLLKVKRFADSEGKIIQVDEQLANGNEAKTNALGRTERSSHKANLVPKGTMGALVLKDLHHGWTVSVGTGFDDKQRAWFWENRQAVLGRIVKYRYQKAGMKDLPRFPSYVGLRDKIDL
jgi:DNA ligase-1